MKKSAETSLLIIIFTFSLGIGLTWIGNAIGAGIDYLDYIVCIMLFAYTIFRFKIPLYFNKIILTCFFILTIDFILVIHTGDFTPIRGALLTIFFITAIPIYVHYQKAIIYNYRALGKILIVTSLLLTVYLNLDATILKSIPKFWGYEFVSRFSFDALFQRSEDEIQSFFNILAFGNYQRIAFLPFNYTPLGLSYEPHVNMLFVTPAILLIKRNRPQWLLILFIYSFVVGSLTSILSILFVILLENFSKNNLGYKFMLITMTIIVLYYIIDSLLPEFELAQKLYTENRSKLTSTLYWSYLFNPNLHFDHSILEVPQYYNTSMQKLGISVHGTLFFILFYFLALFKIYKHWKNRNYAYLSATIYLVLHSVKLPLQMINYPLWIFILCLRTQKP